MRCAVGREGWWVRRVVKPAVFVSALWPLAWLVRGALAGRLGANPVEKITHWSGFTALTFVLLALSISPLQRALGIPSLVHLRRMLGLYGFFYACLHLGIYCVDQTVLAGVGFSPALMLEDVMKRPYITVGFATFLMLLPLAATSTNGMVKRLGALRWKALHRLAYFAAAGGVLHYLWKGKMEEDWAVAYGLLLVALLGWRLAARWLRRGRAAAPAPAVVVGYGPRPAVASSNERAGSGATVEPAEGVGGS